MYKMLAFIVLFFACFCNAQSEPKTVTAKEVVEPRTAATELPVKKNRK